MAYSTDNPPYLVSQGIGNQGIAVWHYDDDDPLTTVDGDGYFTNGDALGMKVGDIVIHHDLSAQTITSYRVDSVTAGGAADLADGTVIGSATDSD